MMLTRPVSIRCTPRSPMIVLAVVCLAVLASGLESGAQPPSSASLLSEHIRLVDEHVAFRSDEALMRVASWPIGRSRLAATHLVNQDAFGAARRVPDALTLRRAASA